VSSLDQSLRRLGLDYVDIFYHHRPDPVTPLEETMAALDHVVRRGKALYVGISNYDHERTRRAAAILKQLGTPCVIHQPSYSILNRWVEPQLLPELAAQGIGCIVFSPLAQGLLSSKYLKDIPPDSRAAKPHGFLKPAQIDAHTVAKLRALDAIAQARGQTLAQMALSWVLRQPAVTSALIGASRVSQIEECVRAVDALQFSSDELAAIDAIVAKAEPA
jgi:L-glyceraldehyde 3-phosphate reductase